MSNLENLSQQDYLKAKQIFTQAIELVSSSIYDFVEKECHDNLVLIAVVKSLIAMHQDSKGATIKPKQPAASLLQKDNKLHQGHKIGKFEIEKHIGSGGMGDVYLANRRDQQVKQIVAIKVLKNKLNKSALERFQIEKRVLAYLEHPGIARFIDSGEQDGYTYYVMEYIQGVAIDNYCDQHKLTVKQRLNLFIKVCEVVSYAHANLVIHRDLKPSNILVTATEDIKLVDFGIAKPLQKFPGYEEVSQTMQGLYALTPQYAAPEQFKDGVIGTACDVYVLGLLMYELLTKTLAQDLTGLSLAEIEKAISNKITQNASKQVTQQDINAKYFKLSNTSQLKNILTGDLDAIINQAIKKEPEKRYKSVAEMSVDIQNYLQLKPISVRGNQMGYRIEKYIRRNLFPVSVIVTLVAILGSSTYLVSKERDNAIQEKQIAEQVTEFLVSTFKNADPTKTLGEKITAREILEEGTRQINNQAHDSKVKDQLLHTMAEVYYVLASYKQSLVLLEQMKNSNNEVYILKAKIYNQLGDDKKALSELSLYTYHEKTEEELIYLNIKSMILRTFDKTRESRQLAKDMLEKAGLMYGRQSVKYANYLVSYSAKLYAVSDRESNFNNYLTALSIYEIHGESNNLKIAKLYIKIVTEYIRLNKFGLANKYLNKAFDIYTETYGVSHLIIADMFVYKGILKSHEENYIEARESYKEAISIKEIFYGPDDWHLGLEYYNIGKLYIRQGEYQLAIENIKKALLLLNTKKTQNQGTKNFFRKGLAEALIYVNNYEEAKEILSDLIPYYIKANYKAGSSLSKVRAMLAIIYFNQGEYKESEKLINLSISTLRKTTIKNEKLRREVENVYRLLNLEQ